VLQPVNLECGDYSRNAPGGDIYPPF
jgi:hypothetical protein